MFVTFKTWVNLILIGVALILIIVNTTNVDRSYFVNFYEKGTDFLIDFLANTVVFGGGAFLIWIVCLAFANGITENLDSTFTSTYTTKNTTSIISVKNIDNVDYYLVKNGDTYTYSYYYQDKETGKVIEATSDFDHTIVISLEDCDSPSMIQVNNNHNYYKDYYGKIFTNSQHYESTLTNKNNYNNLTVFVIPNNSVLEINSTNNLDNDIPSKENNVNNDIMSKKLELYNDIIRVDVGGNQNAD